MNEWMFNDTPAQKQIGYKGVKQNSNKTRLFWSCLRMW